MRIKSFILMLAISLILISFKCYAPNVNYIVEEELDSSTYEFPEIGEVEAVFTSSPLSDELIGRITGRSYKENDQIGIEDLVYIELTYFGFDDKDHKGEMILNGEIADDVIAIFKDLYEAKFPIGKIRIIDEYGGSDELSMLDNNTSAFCYREIAGVSGKLSKHSYGLAIDINPVQNPYVKGDIVLPESGKDYLDRRDIRKGMITEGDACYKAFKAKGWTWGGDWKASKDYQHFEFALDP